MFYQVLRHKHILRDTLLPLSVFLAFFRLDWDPILQHHVELPEFHDMIAGQSMLLTETNFHNWYNSYHEAHLHPKSLHHVNTTFSSTLMQDFHSLFQDRNRTLNTLRQQRNDIITLLLDHQESRTIPTFHNFQNSAIHNDNNHNSADVNHNIIDSPESEEELGAAGPADFQNEDALSIEDINMIEMLWAQDIDMGVSRDDSNPFKTELLVEKEKPIEEPEKPVEDSWQQYSIDGETGEYLPIFVQHQQPPQTPEVNRNEEQVTAGTNADMTFAECLQLLDEFEEMQTSSVRTIQQPLISAQDIEQRWQDLADYIPELNSNISQSQNTESLNIYQYTSWNQTVPSENPDVFAFNATTNGNVNLQNATDRSLQSLGNGSQHLNNSQLLAIENQESQILYSSSQANESDLFSSISRLGNINLNASPTGTPRDVPGTNMPNFMFHEPLAEEEPALPPEITAELNADREQEPRNGSLLLELLNSPTEPKQEETDEEIEDIKNLLDEFDDEDMEISDDNSSFAGGDEAEGATGYNLEQSLFKFQKSEDVYRRGGSSPCGSESGSTSSFDSNNSNFSQKFSENIQHNHTYASSSDSNTHTSSRASNSSHNSSSEEEQEHRSRPSRDERRAKALNIPIPVDKIINLPVDTFNDLLKKYELNDSQMQLIRDIRRRGKNKVAAQNCRKRKISAISMAECSLQGMKSEHEKLLKERDKVFNDMRIMQKKYDELYQQVFQNMRDRNGQHVNPNDYHLEVMDDGSVILVPRNGSPSSNSSYHGK